MRNIMTVGKFQSFRHLVTYKQADFKRKAFLPFYYLLQISAVDIFHGDIVVSVSLPVVYYRDYVFMMKLGGLLGFLLKPDYESLVHRKVLVHYLHRYRSIQRKLDGLVYISHPASTNQFQDLVVGY